MSLNQEIRRLFAVTPVNNANRIQQLNHPYEAWVIRTPKEYGVGVPISDSIQISERFAGAKLHTVDLIIDGRPIRLLLLSSENESLRMEFSTICAQFADPGESGLDRRALLSSPQQWWERWRSLLGNIISIKHPYTVLGELLTIKHLLTKKQNIVWTGAKGGVIDIVTDSCEYEVKSTTMRYESEVTISGQFQLSKQDTKPLNLIFCRFEYSPAGVSINQIVQELTALGMPETDLEQGLTSTGFEQGSSVRTENYKLIEMRRYIIDNDFPGITLKSFKTGNLPEAVKQLTYRMDLTGIPYESWLNES